MPTPRRAVSANRELAFALEIIDWYQTSESTT
jgi:hypothetical protein